MMLLQAYIVIVFVVNIFFGDMAEWLGRGLQNLVRRFESACRLFELLNFVRKLLIPYQLIHAAFV